MSPFSRKTLIVLGASFLLLALTTAVARGTPPLQEPAQVLVNTPGNALMTQLGTAFTYQGVLSDGGSPADGVYDFRFRLYDTLAGGTLIAGPLLLDNVPVEAGLFTVALDFGAVFTGEALWLNIAVRPGAGGGTYTNLAPRQPLTAAPYALGLLPGATLSNPAGNALVIANAGNHGLLVESTVDEGVRVNNAGDDGFFVSSAGSDGVQVSSAADDGFDVGNAGSDGVFVGTAADDGLQVNSAGDNGIEINDAGNNGVQIGHADGDGIFICATGVETACSSSGFNNGVEIGNAEGFGVFVDSAGGHGVFVGSAGLNGVDVTGDLYAGYFRGNVAVTGSCIGCLLATFGVNTGSDTLQPGDLVTVQGTRILENDSTPMLLEVAPAKPGQTVIGVVQGWAELVSQEDPRPTEIGLRLIPREGPVEPGGFVTIIYNGPVQVKASALDGSITAGTRLRVGDDGGVRTLQMTELNGITIAENAPIVGIALSEPDENGLVWVLLNPQ